MFCQTCGAQMSGSFCTSCGARASVGSGASVSPPPLSAGPPLAPAAKTGAGMKILFVVLGLLGVMGVLFMGGIWYVAHRVKVKAAENGINLTDLSDRPGPARRLDACELLSKAELSQILSVPVERVEGGGSSTHSTCRYFSAAAEQKSSDDAAAAMKHLQEAKTTGNGEPTPEQTMKELGSVIRGVTVPAGNGQILSLEVDTVGAKASMTGFKIGVGVMGKSVGIKQGGGEILNGIGDEAAAGPLGSLFMFRKGDVAVQLDGRTLPGGQDTEVAIAKRILAKL